MLISVDGLFEPALQVLLVSIRVAALFMFFPVLGHSSIPMPVRLASALTLSAALRPIVVGALPDWTLQNLPTLAQVIYFVSSEFIIGAGMGLVVKWMFSTVVAAAHWVGHQMGFSQGGLMNPELGTSESAWTEFHQWVAMMLFLGVGGHWFMIQAMADSYLFDFSHMFARLSNVSQASQFWIEIGERFFVWMLKLSGPMVVVLLLLQAALGVLSRFIPQINMWLVSIPLTIGVGVFVFTLLSPMYGDALNLVFEKTAEGQVMWLRFLGVR